MKRYLSGVEKKAAAFSLGEDRYIWSHGFSYGDWCAPNENQKQWMAKKKWISTAYYANDCALASKIATILGFEEEAKAFQEKRKCIENAYRNVFTDKKGTLKNEFQTAYVCPLYFGMVSGEERKKYAENLLRLVKEADNHLSTGFLGTPYLLFALSDNGYINEAYDLLLQDTVPSWLYEVKAGGTSIWERWDALRPDGTVNLGKDPGSGLVNAVGGGMVSFNHYANGAVGDWLYRRVAGLEAIEPGYKKFKVAPLVGGGLTSVSCFKKLSSGTIKINWNFENGVFVLSINFRLTRALSSRCPTERALKFQTENMCTALKCEQYYLKSKLIAFLIAVHHGAGNLLHQHIFVDRPDDLTVFVDRFRHGIGKHRRQLSKIFIRLVRRVHFQLIHLPYPPKCQGLRGNLSAYQECHQKVLILFSVWLLFRLLLYLLCMPFRYN